MGCTDFLERMESLCNELGLAKQENISGYSVYDVDINDGDSVSNFKSLVSKLNLVEFIPPDTSFLEEHFKGLGDVEQFRQAEFLVLYDHARLAKSKDDCYYLILQPYTSTQQCLSELEYREIKCKYEVLGKDASFHRPGYSNLVVIYEDKLS